LAKKFTYPPFEHYTICEQPLNWVNIFLFSWACRWDCQACHFFWLIWKLWIMLMSFACIWQTVFVVAQ